MGGGGEDSGDQKIGGGEGEGHGDGAEISIRMKRAIIGDVGAFFDNIVFQGHFKTFIAGYDKLRWLVRKFFFDHSEKLLYLQKIDVDEALNIQAQRKNQKYVPLWEKPAFICEFRNKLIVQYGLKIDATLDSFVMVADMLPGQKEALDLAPVSWGELLEGRRDE